jgi:cysteinyl-tRNA synthetase
MVLQSHYRSPLTYTEESLLAADRGLERLQSAATVPASGADGSASEASTGELEAAARHADTLFHEAMDDDFDSPRAIAAMFDLGRAINRARDAGVGPDALSAAQQMLVGLGAVLGLDLCRQHRSLGEAEPFVDLLVQVRDELRTAKQWALADRIRDELADRGIEIADAATGSTWRKA